MPLKTVATKEEVPEAQRSSAIETKEGKFVYEEAPDPALGDAGKEALRKEREKAKAEKERADALEKERDELALKAKAAEGKVSDTALASLRTEFEAKVKAEKDRADAAEKSARNVKKEKVFDAMAIKAGAIPERLPKMKKDILDRFELNEAGDDLILGDGKGGISTETAADFLSKTYKKESPFFYQGANGSGSGAEGDAGGSKATFDPVKAGKEAAAAEKKENSGRELAFK